MKKNKTTIKQIFGDHYQEFWKNNQGKYPEKIRENLKDLQDMAYKVINEFANGVNNKKRKEAKKEEYFGKVE